MGPNMRILGAAVVGTGFIGPVHVEAIRDNDSDPGLSESQYLKVYDDSS